MPAYQMIIPAIILLLVLWLYFHSARPSLRVLMYHKADTIKKDRLTVTADQLNEQLKWLLEKKYTIISFREFNELENKKRRGRYLIITFDDAYENNLQYALPVLSKTETRATIFIATAFIGQTNEWDGGSEKIMSTAQLQQLPQHIIEFGLHTHTHKNFKYSSKEDIRQEMQQSIDTLQKNNIPFSPVFAYAYGAFPKNEAAQKNMFDIFKENGIRYALRIGNNINYLPLKNHFLIKRIDIRGTDSFFMFKLKVIFGKIRL